MPKLLRAAAAFLVVSVATPLTCVMVIIGALIFLPLPATLPQPKPILESGITHVLDGLESVPRAFEITANKGKFRAINPAQVRMGPPCG